MKPEESLETLSRLMKKDATSIHFMDFGGQSLSSESYFDYLEIPEEKYNNLFSNRGYSQRASMSEIQALAAANRLSVNWVPVARPDSKHVRPVKNRSRYRWHDTDFNYFEGWLVLKKNC